MSIYAQSSLQRRTHRIRAKLKGSSNRPRLTVFRSHLHIYAQIIDDNHGRTLASANDFQLETKPKTRIETAGSVGKLIAAKALKAKIKQIKFDRGPYNYHGRVKALAEAVRKEGLEF